ncbi:unnamed protein product, partial [Prorocentrum cordatum]
MWEATLELNVISYSAVISACATDQQWQRALALLSEMCEATLEPNAISYSAVISSCEKCEQWQRALSLLSEMWEATLEPNAISYSAVISACGKCEQWQRALALLSEMREATLETDVIQLQRWDHRVREGRAVAAGSGAAQRDAGGDADTRSHLFSYSAGISACEKGAQWQRALALLSEMR